MFRQMWKAHHVNSEWHTRSSPLGDLDVAGNPSRPPREFPSGPLLRRTAPRRTRRGGRRGGPRGRRRPGGGGFGAFGWGRRAALPVICLSKKGGARNPCFFSCLFQFWLLGWSGGRPPHVFLFLGCRGGLGLQRICEGFSGFAGLGLGLSNLWVLTWVAS